MTSTLFDFYYRSALDKALINDLSGAIMDGKKALGLSDNNNNAYKLLGLCGYRLGYFDIALFCFERCDEDNLNLINEMMDYKEKLKMGIPLLKQDKYKEALQLFLNISKNTVSDFNRIGCLYYLLKNHKKARESFKKSLQLDISNQFALQCLTVEKELKISNLIAKLLNKEGKA